MKPKTTLGCCPEVSMIVVDIDNLEAALQRFRPEAVLITVEDPDELPTDTKVEYRLDLNFTDVQLPFPGGNAATREDAYKILHFAERVDDRQVIMHCPLGQSRSAAVAVGVAAWRAGIRRGEKVTEAQLEVAARGPLLAAENACSLGLRDNVQVNPNPWLVALLDYQFDLQGALLRVVLKRYAPKPTVEHDRWCRTLIEMARAPSVRARARVAELHKLGPWR